MMRPRDLCVSCVRFYRKFLSPRKLHPTCRFLPTCSEYAIEAYTRHGVLLGTILALWRILRCNPLNRSPHLDPVPDSFLWSHPDRAKRTRRNAPESKPKELP